jgi:hypothetical protein
MIRPVLAAAFLVLSLPALAQTAPSALPATMHGTWGYEAKSCTDETDDGRVRVGAREVEFFAASCSFRRFRAAADGTLAASGRCRGEGETGVDQSSIRFRQVAPDRLSITLQGSTHVYMRCAMALPVR